jgi:hypothetical protein
MSALLISSTRPSLSEQPGRKQEVRADLEAKWGWARYSANKWCKTLDTMNR